MSITAAYVRISNEEFVQIMNNGAVILRALLHKHVDERMAHATARPRAVAALDDDSFGSQSHWFRGISHSYDEMSLLLTGKNFPIDCQIKEVPKSNVLTLALAGEQNVPGTETFGYGVARAVSPETVARVSAALSGKSYRDFADMNSFDPEAIGLYEEDMEEMLEELREFYSTAAAANQGVFLIFL